LKTKTEIKKIALSTINTEVNAISGLKKFVNDDFVRCVELIYKSKGRVIFTGIGKSANIASKIVATLNSTGTPSIFMHAADCYSRRSWYYSETGYHYLCFKKRKHC